MGWRARSICIRKCWRRCRGASCASDIEAQESCIEPVLGRSAGTGFFLLLSRLEEGKKAGEKEAHIHA